MTTYWAEHAWLPTGAAAGVRFEVVDGRFARVQTRAKAADGDERLPGVGAPGFANAHSHAFHRALRGRTHGDGGNFWTWRQQMYAVTRRLTPETYLALARAVFAEMALAGITVVGEFHYLHHDEAGDPYADPNAMGEALIEAAREAGVRLTLLDTCYLAGGLTGDGHLPLDEVQRRFTDGDVEGWAARAALLQPDDDDPDRRRGPLRARRAARPAAADGGGDAAGMPLHVHLSEQPAENLAAQMFYGAHPDRAARRRGTARATATTAVHATHLSDRDIKLLGSSRTTACFCPTTERDLADGIGPARALAEAGSPISLGSDQHAVIDPFEEVRGLEMHERLASNERGRFTPRRAAVQAATAAGYAQPRLARAAAASPRGRWPTSCVVRTDTVNTAGAGRGRSCTAPTSPTSTASSSAARTVVRHGHHRLGDVAADCSARRSTSCAAAHERREQHRRHRHRRARHL